MGLKKKLEQASEMATKAGLQIVNPTHDPQGKGNTRWLIDKKGKQIGCIRESSPPGKIHMDFEI